MERKEGRITGRNKEKKRKQFIATEMLCFSFFLQVIIIITKNDLQRAYLQLHASLARGKPYFQEESFNLY